jgi:hypothetical protein
MKALYRLPPPMPLSFPKAGRVRWGRHRPHLTKKLCGAGGAVNFGCEQNTLPVRTLQRTPYVAHNHSSYRAD